MRLLAMVLLLLAGSALPALAQDSTPITSVTTSVVAQVNDKVEIPTSPLGEDTLRAVEPATTQLTKRLFMVLDVSGSMRGVENRIGRVLQTVSHVIQQPVDDAEVAIVTFNEQHERWPGVKEPDDQEQIPWGWARLPSATALSYAQGWVASRPQGSGTDPTGALKAAFADTREGFSVVIVTDGEFNGAGFGNDRHFDHLVRDLENEREKKGLGRPPVMIYGVGSNAEKERHLARVGRDHGGGFWVDKDLEGKPVEPLMMPRHWTVH